MLAILEDMKSGEVGSYEVPPPEIQNGGILVRTMFSAISAGTERMKVEQGKMSLIGKAITRPDLVHQVLEYAKSNGIKAAYQKVQARLETLSTMGYSCSGTVLEVSDGVTEFRPGERVACAGAGYANHCEVNFVPSNLAVLIPSNVSLQAAALTTIGAIAMQGVRQAKVEFGETVAVIGAGLVGVLTMQIARAAGCRVVAIDLSPERAKRAVELGSHIGLVSSDPALVPALNDFSRYGIDAAIITAATPSVEPVELAAKILRDRGRIVIVGDVGLGVSRCNMYMKELTLVLSRSYGPGRYDPQYEEEGMDYPIGYVRWTERRNMEAFLDLLSAQAINVDKLLEGQYPASQAGKAYADLKSGIYTAIIDYGGASKNAADARVVSLPSERPRMQGELRVGCLGAGNFARSMIFPKLQALKGVKLESIASSTGVAAASACKGFHFACAQTPSDLLHDENVDAAFILTRHDSHAQYVVAALQNQKAVFVEKPLAVNSEQLEEVRSAYNAEIQKGRSPFLMVGFNRRFAPLTEELMAFFAKRQEPMMIHARINAGFIAGDHWIQRKGNGGRIVGEFCHFVDWARGVIGAPMVTVQATAMPDGTRYHHDNIAVTLAFQDGSVANLLYLANGDRTVAKEHFEVFCEGGVARLDDFRSLELSRGGRIKKIKSAFDKGHRKELDLTVEAMRSGCSAPIPFAELAEVTEATFAVHAAISKQATISLGTDLATAVQA